LYLLEGLKQTLITLWLGIQYLAYEEFVSKKKTRHIRLRLDFNFLAWIDVRKTLGSVMGLYLHNIWIHWPSHFEKGHFDQESTDEDEGFLAPAKRIIKYLTDRSLKVPLRIDDQIIYRRIY